MKYNLNSYIMNSRPYLNYIFEKYGGSDEEYIKFYEKHNSPEYIYLIPYMYTFSKVKIQAIVCFKIFFFNYLEKSGIGDYSKSELEFFELVSKDIVLVITLIIAAQYYFL